MVEGSSLCWMNMLTFRQFARADLSIKRKGANVKEETAGKRLRTYLKTEQDAILNKTFLLVHDLMLPLLDTLANTPPTLPSRHNSSHELSPSITAITDPRMDRRRELPHLPLRWVPCVA